MPALLTEKVAAVTGGTRGIGRAIAQRLLEEGARVAICGRSQSSVKAATKELADTTGGTVLGEAADISKLEDVRRFFEKIQAQLGGLDILINNAGVGVFRSIKELTPEEWHRTVDLNLSGIYYCCYQAIPMLRSRGGGYIINISSLAGKNPFAGGAAYNASKFGVNGFSEAIMMDLRYDGIRVSYILPGSVATEFGASAGNGNWKIAPRDIADVVMTLLRMPERTLISRVEIRPTKPNR